MKAVEAVPLFMMAGLFVLIDFLALSVTPALEASVSTSAAGATVAFGNPNDPWNLVYFFLVLIVFTAVILLVSKFWKKQAVKIIFLGAIALLDAIVFYSLLTTVLSVGLSLGLSIAASALILVMLVKNPEWYVIDTSGVLSAFGAIALVGISLSISIVLVFLIGMAVYDAISVYKTKHMIDLASTSLEQKLPVLFIIPKKRGYSFAKEVKSLKEKLRTGEKRDAFFVGLGDVIIPGILVVSAFHNLASNGFLMAMSVVLGTLVGFIVLTAFVLKGKPQAGLPFLCTGAIIGYLLASYLIFGAFVT
jgi:presenilin-like A22 family membrane protease